MQQRHRIWVGVEIPMPCRRELRLWMMKMEILVAFLFLPVLVGAKCGIAQKQGRRPHQEDWVLCLPQLLLPDPGGCSEHGLNVGLFGVFDGHNGAEASDYASRKLPHLLQQHYQSSVMLELNRGQDGVYAEMDPGGKTFKDYPFVSFYKEVQKEVAPIKESCKHSWSSVSLCLKILKEALSSALQDIDSALTIKYWKENWQSGTTAVVVLKVDDHLLVANIGDSKALVCFSSTSADIAREDTSAIALQRKDTTSRVLVKELTIDHRPDRVDEKRRIEAAGGFVSTWGGIARVNGQLALSRAIGDAIFKKYGVIAEPEFWEWQVQSMGESYLVIMSDGIFEKMFPQDVCNLLQQKLKKIDELTVELDYEAFANTIVDTAYESGSYDNMAVIVYPLRPSGIIEPFKNSKTHPWDDSGSNYEIEDDQNLLVVKEGECYELVEKVPNGVVLPLHSFVGLVPSGGIGKVLSTIDGIEGLMELNVFSGIGGSPGPIEWFNDQLICLRRPTFSDEEEVCLNPEMFSTYLRLIEGVPMVGRNFSNATSQDNVDGFNTSFYSYTKVHERYILKKNIGRGGFGEVWFAVSKNCSGIESSSHRVLHSKRVLDSALSEELDAKSMACTTTSLATTSTKSDYDHQRELFVLKRILVEKGNEVYLSGMREKHFGEVFRDARKVRDSRTTGTHKRSRLQEPDNGIDHIARYVESFEGTGGDLWLVFMNEGLPLSSMLYAANSVKDKSYAEGHIRVLEPSNWWKWLKTTTDGQRELRNLLYQLLLGVKACHDWNITHRDIKPENMIVQATGTCSAEVDKLHKEFPCNLSMRIIDFGSALDAYSIQNLYGVKGPSRTEQTEEYTPPEAFLQRNWLKVYGKHATGYDLWSIGVVMLELVLGTPHVFQIAARTRALLDQHLAGWGSSALNTAYMLRALMEMCILYPGSGGHYRQKLDTVNSNLASWMCTEESLMQLIQEHDPLGIGLDDIWALRLLRGLLQWHPEDRMTAEEALKHPYFHPSLQGKEGQKR